MQIENCSNFFITPNILLINYFRIFNQFAQMLIWSDNLMSSILVVRHEAHKMLNTSAC